MTTTHLNASRSVFVVVATALALWASGTNAGDANPAKIAEVHGGLVIQLGASETKAAAELSLTGRCLIHVLDPDAEKVQAARSRIRKDGY